MAKRSRVPGPTFNVSTRNDTNTGRTNTRGTVLGLTRRQWNDLNERFQHAVTTSSYTGRPVSLNRRDSLYIEGEDRRRAALTRTPGAAIDPDTLTTSDYFDQYLRDHGMTRGPDAPAEDPPAEDTTPTTSFKGSPPVTSSITVSPATDTADTDPNINHDPDTAQKDSNAPGTEGNPNPDTGTNSPFNIEQLMADQAAALEKMQEEFAQQLEAQRLEGEAARRRSDMETAMAVRKLGQDSGTRGGRRGRGAAPSPAINRDSMLGSGTGKTLLGA